MAHAHFLMTFLGSWMFKAAELLIHLLSICLMSKQGGKHMYLREPVEELHVAVARNDGLTDQPRKRTSNVNGLWRQTQEVSTE